MPEIIVKLGDSIVQKYFFVRETMSIGRAPDNEIVIENLAISRNHAVIRCEEGRYLMQDLGSANGTYVNGVKVKKTELMDRDVITLGKHKLYFYDQRADAVPQRRPAMADIDSTMMVSSLEPEPAPQRAQLIVSKGRQKGHAFTLDGSVQTLGRGPENPIRISDWFVSKQHAQIERRGSEFVIRDLGSWRHTVVNGTSVEEAVLATGDVIQLGPTTTLTFQLIAEPASERIESRLPIELEVSQANVARADAPEDEEVAAATPDAFEELFVPQDEAEQMEPAEAAEVATDEVSSIEFNAEPAPAAYTNGSFGNGSSTNGHGHTPEHMVSEMIDYSVAAAADATHDPLLRATGVDSRAEALHEEPATEADDAADSLEAFFQAASSTNGHHAAEVAVEPVSSEPVVSPATAEAADAEADTAPQGEGDPGEIAMWERALENKSPLIRKQAARRLKQLTGKDYAY